MLWLKLCPRNYFVVRTTATVWNWLGKTISLGGSPALTWNRLAALGLRGCTDRLMYSRVVRPLRIVQCVHESCDPYRSCNVHVFTSRTTRTDRVIYSGAVPPVQSVRTWGNKQGSPIGFSGSGIGLINYLKAGMWEFRVRGEQDTGSLLWTPHGNLRFWGAGLGK